MKNIYFPFLVFIVAVISGCSKDTHSVGGYTVTGIADITAAQFADTTVNVIYHVIFPGGISDPITLTVTGLPPGVTVSPASISDSNSFSAQFTYHIQMNAVASYPVTVSLFSSLYGLKTFTFNIIITNGVPFSYTISRVADTTLPLYTNATIHIPVTATYNAGTKESVTIYADGLPAGVTVTPASATGIPTFTDTFAFHVIANSTGSFPVTLHTTTPQGTTESSFNINIAAGSDCSAPLVGSYSGNTVCASYTGAGTGIAPLQVYGSATNQLLVELPFAYVKTDLNCGTGILDVEPAASGIYNVTAGTGSFNASTMTINYTITGAVNSNCTTTLTR